MCVPNITDSRAANYGFYFNVGANQQAGEDYLKNEPKLHLECEESNL